MNPNYSIYFIADSSVPHRMPVLEVIRIALDGGITMLQLREKKKSSREFIDYAMTVRELTRAYAVPLIINDRISVAQAVDADGVHLGQTDFPCIHARRILGPDRLIGLSAHTESEAVEAEQMGADYVGIGSVFETATKENIRGIIGPEGFAKVRARIHIPAVAIGGITKSNAAAVIQAGADGIAVISAIMNASDVKLEVELLRRLWIAYSNKN